MTDARHAESLLVGAHFGIVEELARVRPEADDLPLAVYAARLARRSNGTQAMTPLETSGAALTDDAARLACLGEAVERYASGQARPGAIVRATCDELPQAISPARFALFAAHQYGRWNHRFPFRAWQAEDQLEWVSGTGIADDACYWVPAVFVFHPYVSSCEGRPLAPSISTGLACGGNWDEALAAALCEVIERDAVALAWLRRIVPKRVTLANIDPSSSLARLVELVVQSGFRWSVIDLTTDWQVPVFAALLEGHSAVGRIVSFGSACHRNPRRAVEKALIEAAHGRMYVKSLIRREPAWRADRRFRQVVSFADHARYYSCHPRRQSALDRWWESDRKTTLAGEEPPAVPAGEWLRRQARQMQSLGYAPLAVDLTTPDIAEIGWHVARVVVPGLQPLHGHHAWPHLGGRRLLSVEAIFGDDARPRPGINPYPHPCP